MKKFYLLLGVLCLLSLISCSKKTDTNTIDNNTSTSSKELSEKKSVKKGDFENSSEFGSASSEEVTGENNGAGLEGGGTGMFSSGGGSNEIIISKDDVLPPDPVSNLKAEFNWKTNKIDLSWTDPGNPGFAYVEIRNNKNDEVVKVPRGKEAYAFDPQNKKEHTYSVITVSALEKKGPESVCSVSNPYLFTSFYAPEVANTGSGSYITATVSGKNFTNFDLEGDDFSVKCRDNSSITSKARVRIIDDKTLYISLVIPKRAGDYTVTVSCGALSTSGTFKVYDYSYYSVGKLVSEGGVPVAVIAGYDSRGYPFGIGLKESKCLKWATESSYGYDTCFNRIVCYPSDVGSGSASSASFSGDIDGANNWDVICESDPNCKLEDGSIDLNYVKSNYPMFHYALTYGKTAKIPEKYAEDWYVPSLSELSQIYINREKIAPVLAENGGKKFRDDFYWSSSQNDYRAYNACAVKFSNGSIYKYYYKSNAIYVRCIRSFK